MHKTSLKVMIIQRVRDLCSFDDRKNFVKIFLQLSYNNYFGMSALNVQN